MKKEEDVVELVSIFAKMYNSTEHKIEGSLNSRCRWHGEHRHNTGRPEFLIRVWFEYTAKNEHGVEHVWKKYWTIHKWYQHKARDFDWGFMYLELLQELFKYTWLAGDSFSLTEIAKGDVVEGSDSFTGRGMYAPFSKIKDAIRKYKQTWYERASEDFIERIKADMQTQFDREHELIIQRNYPPWVNLEKK